MGLRFKDGTRLDTGGEAQTGQTQKYVETHFRDGDEGLGPPLKLYQKAAREQAAVKVPCCCLVYQWAFRAVSESECTLGNDMGSWFALL